MANRLVMGSVLKGKWESTKIHSDLLGTIKSAVETVKEYGAPKYRSVPHFLEEAAKQLLVKEGVKAK